MKTRFLLLLGALTLLLTSCSTDVDLYADPEEIPVIYGLLNCEADTNFIRITRVVHASDNPLLDAANSSLSEYPGKLDVRLTEFRNDDSIRQIVLDTITLHNKQSGIFYAPNQKVYYTTEPLGTNNGKNKYKYKLTIVFPDRVVTTEAKLVGTSSFGPKSLALNFAKSVIGTRRPYHFHPALNASVYRVDMSFTYHERRTPLSDTIPHTMRWHVGTFFESDLGFESEDDYILYYYPADFYGALEDFIGGDTAVPGLKRFLSDYPATITITAGGGSLREYLYYLNMVNQANPNDTDFTTIPGAKGVFSSIMTKTQRMRLGDTTVPDLIAEEKWGFAFMGGQEP